MAFDYMLWLGAVGGIAEVLERSFSFILGGYLMVNWEITTMISLYLEDSKEKCALHQSISSASG